MERIIISFFYKALNFMNVYETSVTHTLIFFLTTRKKFPIMNVNVIYYGITDMLSNRSVQPDYSFHSLRPPLKTSLFPVSRVGKFLLIKRFFSLFFSPIIFHIFYLYRNEISNKKLDFLAFRLAFILGTR